MRSRFGSLGLIGVLVTMIALIVVMAGQKAPAAPEQVELEIAKVFFEFNSSANDLGVQVLLDGEDWTRLRIDDPDGHQLFAVQGRGPYGLLGLTELFFEGAEPSLDEVPLEELLDLFPEGTYEFSGRTVDNASIVGAATLTHAIPAGPVVSAELDDNSLVISWDAVTGPPAGFPDRPINIVGYQVIVETFQVTVPGTTLSVTVSPEFVASLAPGTHQFEVLAIEAGGNQTITEGSFVKP